MIAYGQVGEILRDLKGGWRLTFTVDQPPEAEELQALTGKQLEITARPKREHRDMVC